MNKEFLVVGQVEVREIITAEDRLSAEHKFFDKYPAASTVDTIKEIEESQVPQSTYPYPKYVMIKNKDGTLGCALQKGRYWTSNSNDETEIHYYRIAGAWDLNTIVRDGKLFVYEPDLESHLNHIHGQELVEVTRDVWGKDNQGYTGDPKYDGDTKYRDN